MRGAFADRRFRRLLIGESLSTFGDTALYLTLGIWAKSLTHSNAAAGSVFLALGIPALFGPLTGHVADRLPRRPLMIGADAATAMIVLLLLAVRSRDQLWIIYVVAFLYGISFSVLGSAGAGLRKDMLDGEYLAGANAAFQSIGQGMRIVAPLAGAGLFIAFGGGAVAVLDVVTFAIAIAALSSIKVTESGRARGADENAKQPFRREVAAGFRHLRSVPLLLQITTVTAVAFSVIGLIETIIFAVISEGLHRPPSFFGVYGAVQGAGAIAGGIPLAFLIRRMGSARVVGLSLAAFSLASAACITGSLWLVLAAAVGDGIGLVWLVAAATTATQRYTPPSLQGRVNAAFMMLILTPQTVSIAAGAALISFVDYRLMLAIVAVAIGAGALVLLLRPAPEPARDAVEPASEAAGSGELADAPA
ncbi:MAG: MFS transporter [Nocardiopsaceae bacterium]|jgi:MFS family permease|nr:MFS transporter [Nocardiopsaceae bacterium]